MVFGLFISVPCGSEVCPLSTGDAKITALSGGGILCEVGNHPRVSKAGMDVPSPVKTMQSFTGESLKSVGWRLSHVKFVSYPV